MKERTRDILFNMSGMHIERVWYELENGELLNNHSFLYDVNGSTYTPGQYAELKLSLMKFIVTGEQRG